MSMAVQTGFLLFGPSPVLRTYMYEITWICLQTSTRHAQTFWA
jgi:hypothetical protein